METKSLTSADLIAAIRRWDSRGMTPRALDWLAEDLAPHRPTPAQLAELLERQPVSRPLRTLAIEVLACWVDRAREAVPGRLDVDL